MAETFFRVAKTAISVPRNKFWKNILESKKNATSFKILNELSLSFLAYKSCRVVKTAINLSLQSYEEKNFFEALDIVSNLFGLWAKKKTFSRKASSRVVTTAICASIVAFFKKNHFFFFIDSYFPFVSGIWAISLSFSKKFSQECQKCMLSAQMKKFGGIYFWKKSDFHILFGLWTEKLQYFTGKL